MRIAAHGQPILSISHTSCGRHRAWRVMRIGRLETHQDWRRRETTRDHAKAGAGVDADLSVPRIRANVGGVVFVDCMFGRHSGRSGGMGSNLLTEVVEHITSRLQAIHVYALYKLN